MKYLFALLLLCFTLAASAQGNPGQQPLDKNEPSFHTNQDEPMRMAGERLQKHSRQFFLGTGMLVGGAIINQVADAGPAVSVAATLLSLGGFVIQTLSHRHIGRAGKLLEESALQQRITLQGSSTGTGIALAYRF